MAVGARLLEKPDLNGSSKPPSWLFRSPAGANVGAAVLLPALFRLLGAYWLILTIGNGFNPVWRDAGIHQEVLGGGGAAVAKGKVVFFAPAVVALAFNREFAVWLFFHQARVSGERLCSIGADVRFVQTEVRVFDVV